MEITDMRVCVYCMYVCELGWRVNREQNYWQYGMKLMKLTGNKKTTVYKNILFYHFKLFLYIQNRIKKKKNHASSGNKL